MSGDGPTARQRGPVQERSKRTYRGLQICPGLRLLPTVPCSGVKAQCHCQDLCPTRDSDGELVAMRTGGGTRRAMQTGRGRRVTEEHWHRLLELRGSPLRTLCQFPGVARKSSPDLRP